MELSQKLMGIVHVSTPYFEPFLEFFNASLVIHKLQQTYHVLFKPFLRKTTHAQYTTKIIILRTSPADRTPRHLPAFFHLNPANFEMNISVELP